MILHESISLALLRNTFALKKHGEQVQNQEPEPFAQEMKECVGDTFVRKHRHQDRCKYHQ